MGDFSIGVDSSSWYVCEPTSSSPCFPGYEFYWGGEVIELEGGGAPDSAALFDLVHHVVSLFGDLVVEDNDGFIANLIAGRARVDDVVSGYFARGGWDLQNIVFKGTGRIGAFGAHL